ncbi:hypothetical protein RNJ44_05112 [Nakaseomyces bracarensis]|uniref:Uncharacterized protein n=1 Tax=Nakaseomyces bracarensis TaxID=273131 RepID=A0ABR4NX01_9SACH
MVVRSHGTLEKSISFMGDNIDYFLKAASAVKTAQGGGGNDSVEKKNLKKMELSEDHNIYFEFYM